MPTVIDALVLSLGLDASAFVKGQKDVAASFARTKESTTKAAGEVEKSAKGMADNIAKATSAFLELTAVFLGGRGFDSVVKDITKVNNSLGQMQETFGASPQFVAALTAATERMGGTAGATMGSITGLADALTKLRVEGKSMPDSFYRLEGLSRTNIDQYGKIEDVVTGIATAANKLAQTDRNGANLLLRELGLDPTTANLFIRQGAKIADTIKELEKLTPRPKDIAAAGGLTSAWAELNQQFSYAFTRIVTDLSPALIALSEALSGMFHAIGQFAEQHPHWTEGIAAAIGLFSGLKILSAIKNILSLTNALTGLATANGVGLTGGILGFLARLPPVLAAIEALDIYEHSTLNSGEDERQRQQQYGHGSGGGGGSGAGNEALRRRAYGGGDEGGGGSTGKPRPGGWWTPERQKHAFQVLRENGVSERGAIALISRWKNVESHGRGPDDINPYSGAYGIEQGLGSRKPRTNDFDEQLKAAARETKTGDGGGSGRIFDNAQDDREAARGASVHERAEGWNGRTDNFQNTTLAGMAEVRRNVLGGIAPLPSSASQGDADYQAHRGGRVPMPANMPSTGGAHKDVAWPSTTWHGWKPIAVHGVGIRAGAARAATLSSIRNNYNSSTTSSSNEMHIQNLNVNAPQATDARAIAVNINSELEAAMFSTNSNFGPA